MNAERERLMVEGEVDQERPVPLPLSMNEWTSDSIPNDID